MNRVIVVRGLQGQNIVTLDARVVGSIVGGQGSYTLADAAGLTVGGCKSVMEGAARLIADTFLPEADRSMYITELYEDDVELMDVLRRFMPRCFIQDILHLTVGEIVSIAAADTLGLGVDFVEQFQDCEAVALRKRA